MATHSTTIESSAVTEELWLKIVVIIVAAVLILVLSFNVNVYWKLRNSSVSPVGQEEANILLIVNAIFLVIAVLLFIWSLYRLFVARDYREHLEDRFEQQIRSQSTGFDFRDSPLQQQQPLFGRTAGLPMGNYRQNPI